MPPKPNPPKFLDLLKEELELEEKERERQYAGAGLRHNPSSASFKKASKEVVGACLRAIYYRATGTPETEKKTLSNRLQLGFGDAIHTWLLGKFSKSGRIRITPEASGRSYIEGLEKEISYRLDGLVTSNGELGGLEIKTQQAFGLQRMIKEGGPKEAHLLQVLSYFATNEDIKWFSLLYFGRDNGFCAEYHIYKLDDGKFYVEGVLPKSEAKEIGELAFPGIVSRWKELETAVESKTIPARDFKAVLKEDGTYTKMRVKNAVEYKSDFNCDYCNYRTLCWSSHGAKEDSIKIPS